MRNACFSLSNFSIYSILVHCIMHCMLDDTMTFCLLTFVCTDNALKFVVANFILIVLELDC